MNSIKISTERNLLKRPLSTTRTSAIVERVNVIKAQIAKTTGSDPEMNLAMVRMNAIAKRVRAMTRLSRNVRGASRKSARNRNDANVTRVSMMIKPNLTVNLILLTEPIIGIHMMRMVKYVLTLLKQE